LELFYPFPTLFHIAADFFYRQSLEQNSNAPEATALAEYGSFLEHCREFDAAELYYLKALTVDPNHVGALKLYATFLQEVRQSISLGDRFLARYQGNCVV
jgi:tetratricopeptide (TPR) repeat protein